MPKILVAEDSKYYRKLLEETLKEWDYEVVLAGDGAQAWEILQREDSPQIVILDWIMPEMSGLEVCRAVREKLPKPYRYIILLSGMDGQENIFNGLEAGADDYIIKPFNQQELKYRLRIGQRIIEYENSLLRLAMTDPLTGILNRWAFMERLESEIQRSRRFKSPLTLVIMDIDDFKRVNDTHGHQVGDKVICCITRELSKSIRSYDFLGRYGGDELVLCLPGVGHPKAQAVVERLRCAVENVRLNLEDADGSISVTASFGFTCLNDSPDECLDSLVKRADEALYLAKAQGKNQVRAVL
ncbi:MAG: diguanylate cyclase [Peptococcaceae bacterium]|jgi:two-component system chemotaxis response regulator CheY|nr:diguanylate cyclase [Peptococcaceae bacterium]MDH7524716.1 diguanylate cyclase [Peptococcaceae bacterium]